MTRPDALTKALAAWDDLLQARDNGREWTDDR